MQNIANSVVEAGSPVALARGGCHILLVQDTTCFFRISNKGVNTVSFIVGTAPKESVVVQI